LADAAPHLALSFGRITLHWLQNEAAQALHADAALWARQEGIFDPSTQHSERDETGRFAPRSSSTGGGSR
jgi:hypothetical protein